MKNNIADIFKYYGMKDIGEEYKEKIKTGEDEDFIETIPFLESYWLTRLDIWIIANYFKLPIILLYYPNMTLIETQQSFCTLSTYFYDTSEVVELLEADAEHHRDSSSEEDIPFMGMAAPVPKKYTQEYYFIAVPRIKSEGTEVPTYSIISKDNQYLLPLSEIRPQVQNKILEEMSKHYVSSSGRGSGLSMDDLDNVFERELKKDEFTENKEYIVSFVRNFNLYIMLKERERAMSVFSAESQSQSQVSPPELLELDLGQGESQIQTPEKSPPFVQLEPALGIGLGQKKLPSGKSSKHVMPPSLAKVEKDKEKEKQPKVSKKLAPVSVDTSTASKASEKPKKPRVKGIAIPKLNLNPVEEETPPLASSQPQAPAPLLKLPTFQAKGSSKKIKPISVVGSSVEPTSMPSMPSIQPQIEQQEE
jgi:hypothetical protein